MFLPGGSLSGALLPWILLAPALPLAAALVKRPSLSISSVSLLLSTLVSLLIGIFGFLSSNGEAKPALLQFTLFLDAAMAFFLLWLHSNWFRLRQVILAAGLLFAGVFIALALSRAEHWAISQLTTAGYFALFLASLAVILSHMQELTEYITRAPAFWISAGICFQYGLTGLLLLMNPHESPEKILADADFGLMYTIIDTVRFLFFAIAVFLYRSQPTEPRQQTRLR